MSLAVGLAHVVLLLAAGWWPMRVMAHEAAGTRWWSRASWSLGLGAALVGLVQVLLSWLGIAAHMAVPASLAALSVLLALFGRAGRAPLPAEAALPRPLAVLLLVVALVGTLASAGLPFRSDGSKFWAPRARDLALSGAADAPALHDPARLAHHREYPLLAPALLAPVFASSPQDATAGPKLVLAALQLALLGMLAALLARCGRTGRWLLVAFVTMPMLVSLDVRESVVAGGFVDGVVALFLLMLVVVVQRLRLGQGDRSDVTLAILLGSALVATKLEGAAELALVGGAWLLVGPQRARAWTVLAGAALLALPTLFIQADVVPDPPGFGLARLMDGVVLHARLVPVAAGLGGELLNASSFGLLPLALVLAWFAGRTAGGTRSRAWLGWMLLGLCAFLALIYLTTNMQAARH
ncbi:MAG: hypothetical protein ACYTCU_04815, partial [Planctomycetota bacterium]